MDPSTPNDAPRRPSRPPPPAPDGTAAASRPDPASQDQPGKRLPSSTQYLWILLAILLVLAFAGVPGTADTEAGNGSDKLKQGWAAKHAAATEDASKDDVTEPDLR